MSNKILFIFEGEKTECQISKSLQKHIFNNETNVVVECFFKADIYQLYRKLSADENLDTFNLLKERGNNSLDGYTRNDFAEIYLFFDYDGHAHKADDNNIIELLYLFNNETDKGKLLISYPMVEAIKHNNSTMTFEKLAVCCKENINYKNKVNNESDPKHRDLTLYDIKIWKELIDSHLRKMNYIVTDKFIFPTNIISQETIFQNQLTKFIHINATVSVISAFPVFIHDYFGNVRTKELLR